MSDFHTGASRSVSRSRRHRGSGRGTRRRQRGGERDVSTLGGLTQSVLNVITGEESIPDDQNAMLDVTNEDNVETVDIGGDEEPVEDIPEINDEEDDGGDEDVGGDEEDVGGDEEDDVGDEEDDVGDGADDEEDDEGDEESSGVMDTITRATQAVLGTPDNADDDTEVDVDLPSGVDPSEDTIQNLINDYEFKDKNICLTKELDQKVQADDIVYSIGVNEGKYTKDYGENEPVLVVLYMFPNPLTTGMVISDDSTHLPLDGVVPAGHNARLRSRKMWVPFPGTPGVHIRIMCGVVETVKPVVSGEDVTLNSPVGIAIYSGKLGKIEKYYSGEELQSESKTMVRIGDEPVDVE